MTLSADILFSVIRCGFGLEVSDVQLSENEFAELIEIGKKQSILPIIYAGLKRKNLPIEWMKKADQARSKDMYRFIQHNDAINKICAVLDEAEIHYVLLKGAALRNLYPAIEMRTSADIDVLVHEEEIDKAVRVIDANTDIKVFKRGYHDISMISSKVHLDLHFNMKANSESIDKLLIRAWEYTEPCGKGSRCVFTPEFQIFHVISHMSHHFLHGGLGIRPFLDLWLLTHKTTFDAETVKAMCAECGILTFYEECVRLSEVWLEKAEHTETTALLEEYCLSGGVFGSKVFKYAGRQRDKRGWRYIISRVFPPAYQVKEFYRDESGKKHTLAYYYLKRWIRWLSKKKRGQMMEQIHDVLASDQNYLDNADILFKRLGL